MKALMTSAAFAVLIAAAPALAEDAAKPAAIDQTQTQKAAAPDQTQTQATTPAATPAPAVAATSTPDKQQFIAQQAADTQLASNWIGKKIYNSAGDNVGDVNDLIIGSDGKITGVVVGVGGFLGIGEKNIAVDFSMIQSGTDENGDLKLTVNATKEQLDAAPEFVTVAELKAKQAQPVAPLGDQAPAPAPAQ